MTAQISDSLIYNNIDFDIVSVNGEGLFNPKKYGIKVISISSACWQGFYCKYKVTQSYLQLYEVHLGLDEADVKLIQEGKGIQLFGQIPSLYNRKTGEKITNCHTANDVDKGLASWDYRCDNIDRLVQFTGGMIIGSNFIREMYIHMGFPPAYKLRLVHELIFESGQLIKIHNHSKRVAEFRQRLINKEIDPYTFKGRKEVKQWTKECFEFDYS